MPDGSKIEWLHPHSTEGVESHRFHRENLVQVDGEVLQSQTFLLKDRPLIDSVYKRASVALNEVESQLLDQLKIPPVPGLPFDVNNLEAYSKPNSMFIKPDASYPEKYRDGFSYPEAGRAVTFKEGWMINDRVFLEHDIKGVGKTKSVNWYHLGKKISEGSGVSRDVETDLVGTEMAIENGILTPIILPPIKLNEIIINGERINSDQIFPKDPPLNINRIWASNIRINSLFRSISSFMTIKDVNLVIKEPEIPLKMFRTRVVDFLDKTKEISEFNKANGTNFIIGLSPFLENDFTITSYAKAFRTQSLVNISRMISGEIWHDNCSVQNISIAGEIGDWDSYAYIEDGKFWRVGSEYRFKPTDQDTQKADTTYDVVHQIYLAQAYISAISQIDFISESDYWDKVRVSLPDDNWAKNLNWDEVIDISNGDGIPRHPDPWEKTFQKMTDLFKNL